MRALARGRGVKQAGLSFGPEEATWEIYTPPSLSLLPPRGQPRPQQGEAAEKPEAMWAPGKARPAPGGSLGSSRDGGHSVTEEETAHRSRSVSVSSLESREHPGLEPAKAAHWG